MRFLLLIAGIYFSISSLIGQSELVSPAPNQSSVIDDIKSDSAYVEISNYYLIEKDAANPLIDSLIRMDTNPLLLLNVTPNKTFINNAFYVCPKSIFDTIALPNINYLDGDSIKNNMLHIVDTALMTDSLKQEIGQTEQFSNHSATSSIPYQISPNGLNKKVVYTSKDSIVFDINAQEALIHGAAKVDYEEIHLSSEEISINWETNRMLARGIRDSNGIVKGEPVFIEGDQTIYAEKIIYNYETEKGDIYNLYTVQGEGYFQGEKVRKQPNDEMLLKNGKYTTCPCEKDEEPKFYLNMSKVKIIPNKVIIAGPSNLVLEGIPTPLFVPFGLFPMTRGRATGIIIPQYGNSHAFGYYLKDGGYYMGINDNWDIRMLADIYTKGKWQASVNSRYYKRYKFKGDFSLRYGVEPNGDRYTANFGKSSDFLLRWTHSKDKKNMPNLGFKSSVEFGTNNFHTQNSINNDAFLQNNMNSSVNFSKRFVRSVWNLSSTITHKQSKSTPEVAFSLPHINLNSKNYNWGDFIASPKERFWKKVQFRYSANYKNDIRVPDTVLFKKLMKYGIISNTLSDATREMGDAYYDSPATWGDYMRNGFRHSLPFKMPFKSGFLNFNFSIPVRQVIYNESYTKSWDPELSAVQTDTLDGISFYQDASLNLTTSTRIYGFFNMPRNAFIKAVKHDITPSLTATYIPDYGEERFGFWDTYWRYSQDSNGLTSDSTEIQYAKYEGVFGKPMRGKSQTLRLNINNFVEAKFINRDSTASSPYQKVKLIDQFNVSGSYNFAVDTLNVYRINTRLRSSLFKSKLTINYNMTHDPYISDSSNVRLNQFERNVNGRLARLSNSQLTLRTRISEKGLTEIKTRRLSSMDAIEQDLYDDILFDYIDFTSPWSLTFNYNFRLNRAYRQNRNNGEIVDSFELTSAVSVNYSLKLTPKWILNGSTGWDFKNDELSYTTLNINRDMDCWKLSIQWVPIGPRRMYNFNFSVKSDLLKDLKYDRKKNHFDYDNFD